MRRSELAARKCTLSELFTFTEFSTFDHPDPSERAGVCVCVCSSAVTLLADARSANAERRAESAETIEA